MYSRPLLNRYVKERLKQEDSTFYQLAKDLGINQSNLKRSMESEKHHLTLSQFGQVTELLQLTPDQVFHILTGKKSKEATSQLVTTASLKLVNELLR
jgi:uncharacterized HAD superfamily protein